MGASATAYLLFDASSSTDKLKAVEVIENTTATTANGEKLLFQYIAELGASNDGLTAISGTITLAAGKSIVTGSSTSFTSEFAVGDKIFFGTGTSLFQAKINFISSDTKIELDRVSTRSYSGATVSKLSFIPDFKNDAILARVATDGSTAYFFSQLYAITAGVTGADGEDGADGTDARAVNLTVGDQTIEYDTNGANPNPSSTTVTATALNTSGTVYYEFFKNDVSVQNTTSNTYSYSAPSSYTSMPEKIEVQIREGSNSGTILARDQITISGLKAGTDAITTILSNEAHTLPTTSGGVVTYTGSGTDIEVWNGTTQVPYDGSAPYASPSFRVTASGSNITVGSASTVSTYTRRFADHNSMTQNNAAITYTIIVKNEAGVENTFTRKQTFAKSIQGADGDPGAPGSPGATGPRTATGYIYYQSASASSPTSGSAVSTSSVSYNFSTSLLSGGVIGTGSTNWNQNPPTFTGSNANKYWYAYYNVIESSYGGSYTVTFSIPYEGQNFTGLVTFTGTNSIDDGSGNSLSFGSSGTTTIDGGNIITGTLTADKINTSSITLNSFTNDSGFVDSSGAAAAAPVQSVAGLTGTITTASLSSAGLFLTSSAGALATQSTVNLGTQTSGTLGTGSGGTGSTTGPYGYADATAMITAESIRLTSNYSGFAAVATSGSKSDIGLGDVEDYSPSNQLINGWSTTITAGALSLGNSSGARIVMDATEDSPRILIVDAT